MSGGGPPQPTAVAVLLDLDGTIIGDVSAAVCEFEILSTHCPDKVKLFKTFLLAQLKSTGIIRPGFASFMRAMRKRDIDVFIYTASESKWATFLIALIEQAVGVSFARPLFTRTQCRYMNGSYVKPCKAVLNSMCTSMKRRGNTGIFTGTDLANRVLYVDNNDVIYKDCPHAPELVLCPTYDFRLDHDVLRLVPEDVFARHWQSIANKLSQYDVLMSRTDLTSRESARIHYYKSLAAMLAKHRPVNKHMLSDRLWPVLETVFARHNPTSFKGKTLEYIKHKVGKCLSSTMFLQK